MKVKEIKNYEKYGLYVVVFRGKIDKPTFIENVEGLNKYLESEVLEHVGEKNYSELFINLK